MTYEEIKTNEEVNAFLNKGNEILGKLGFTDHGKKHCSLVAERAGFILQEFNESADRINIAKIAGYMHDIGNAVNRQHHAEYGGLIADSILRGENISVEDRIEIVSCISNHDESTGGAFDKISAAVIIADKTDVRRNRVRTEEKSSFDIHDRVNFAVKTSTLRINHEKKQISLNLQIDENICTMCDYFDIFLGRMLMCRRAAEFFDCKFKLLANGSKVL